VTKQPSELAALIAAVQIKSVRLVETSAKTNIHSPSEVGKTVECSIDTSTHVKNVLSCPPSFYVIASIHFRLAGNKPEAEPAVSVKASFELEYQLPSEFNVKQKELNDFAEINSVFNAWPYWREYIQNVFSRMNLPPMTLPVYRLKDRMLGQTKPPSLPKTTGRKSRSKPA
jgi:preprotein translocase subunit SecB